MLFGENLRQLRTQKKMSQEKLAEEIGVSRQSVSKWENSITYPETTYILRICDLFGCHINDLIHEDIKDISNFPKEVKKEITKFSKEKQKNFKTFFITISSISSSLKYLVLYFIIILTILLVGILNNKFVSVTENGIKIIEVEDHQEFLLYNRNLYLVEESDKTLLFNDVNIDALNNNQFSLKYYSLFTLIYYILMSYVCFKFLGKISDFFIKIRIESTPFTYENVLSIKEITKLILIINLLPIMNMIIEYCFGIMLSNSFSIINIIIILFVYSFNIFFEYGYEIQKDTNAILFNIGDDLNTTHPKSIESS